MSTNDDAIITIVRLIPSGRVMSYGQIADYIGIEERGAQQVGWAMRELGHTDNFAWWRVLNNAGKITLSENMSATAQQQQTLLESEGIEFIRDLELDINRYRSRLDPLILVGLGLSEEQADKVYQKYLPPPEEPQATLFEGF